jgi:hypothetical protein
VKHGLANFWKLRYFGLVEDLSRNVCRNMKKAMKSLNISGIPADVSRGNVPYKVLNVAATPFSVEKKTKKIRN